MATAIFCASSVNRANVELTLSMEEAKMLQLFIAANFPRLSDYAEKFPSMAEIERELIGAINRFEFMRHMAGGDNVEQEETRTHPDSEGREG